MGSILTLLALRLIRGWNQTGQKFAGESDIVKRFISANPSVLWFLVGAAYLWIHREIIYSWKSLPRSVSYAGATGLVLAGLTFKVAFTNEDAPELVVGVARTLLDMDLAQGASLVTRAKTVFFGLGLAMVVAVGMALLGKWRRSGSQSRTSTAVVSPADGKHTHPHPHNLKRQQEKKTNPQQQSKASQPSTTFTPS